MFIIIMLIFLLYYFFTQFIILIIKNDCIIIILYNNNYVFMHNYCENEVGMVYIVTLTTNGRNTYLDRKCSGE